MIHFALPTGKVRDRATTRSVEPMTPDRYLRLRREAAGLTIAQAARRIFGNDEERVELAAGLIRALETPGIRARVDMTLDRLIVAFPFDVDVYRQLVNEPADRHPRICNGCGCSDQDACVSADGHEACGWHGDRLCTRCARARS